MWSPELDLVEFELVQLEFKQFIYGGVDVGDTCDVDLSLDGGETWATIYRQNPPYDGMTRLLRLELPGAQTSSNVVVRFRLHSPNAPLSSTRWSVDSLVVRVCSDRSAATPTWIPTWTETPTFTASPTKTATPSLTATPTRTASPTRTSTRTVTAVATMTPTPWVPTSTWTASPTSESTELPTLISTLTPTQPMPTPYIIGAHREKHQASSPHVSEWVEVTFASEAGIFYDIYASPSLSGPAWTIHGWVEATGASTTYQDPGPVTDERYYKIGVQGSSPVAYSPNEAGVLPVAAKGHSGTEIAEGTMLGISLESPETWQSIQDVIGWQMTGNGDPDLASEIWRYDPYGNQYAFAWLCDTGGSVPSLDGQWVDPNLGAPSTLAMPLGAGFWAYSKEEMDQTILFDGLVQREEFPMTVLVDGTRIKGHQLGQPLARDVALDEASTTFLADGARGSTDPDLADEIWVYDPAGDRYLFAWLFDSSGTSPSLDGTWIDPNLGGPTSLTLKRGTSWWYYSKPDPSRSPSWTWTEPVP